MDIADEARIRNYIKGLQRNNELSKGKVSVYPVQIISNEAIFKCKIKKFFKKPIYYLFKQTLKEKDIYKYQEIHSDEWDFFEF